MSVLCRNIYRNFCCNSHAHTQWITVKQALTSQTPRSGTCIKGWVKRIRQQKELTFININDGSCPIDLQLVSDSNLIKNCTGITYGSSVEVVGSLVKSTHQKQDVELQVDHVKLLGDCNNEEYPFKMHVSHSQDYVRKFPHLRPRTRYYSSILRGRSQAVFAAHQFLQGQGYVNVQTPIITSSDCEGAGELFHVMSCREMATDKTDENFFKTQAYLTVSGQLHAEATVCGLSKVYTFGPVFRAESSHTSRHLAEFCMLEVESILNDTDKGLYTLMELAESLCKNVFQSLLTHAQDDLAVCRHNNGSENHEEVFRTCLNTQYGRITYTDAVVLLQKKLQKNKPKFGETLSSENEKLLIQETGGHPLFISHFPTSLSPFYAKPSIHDNNLTMSMDLLMPGVGEVIGGTVREDQYTALNEKIRKFDSKNEYQWYLDLRKYGTVPHGGFGLGFDRLLQVAFGVKNIRDIVLFPRYLGYCQM